MFERWRQAGGARAGLLLAGLVLLLGVAVATALAVSVHEHSTLDAQGELERSAERIDAELARRFQQPVYGLKGARGVFAVRQKVTRADFRAYVESRDLRHEFRGVRGFGFVQRVQRGNLDAFLAEQRADGAATLAVRQLEEPGVDDLWVTTFIEPGPDNEGSLGLDIGSERYRREAALRAVDTGQPTITRPITLVQDRHKTPAVLFFLPVYANGKPINSPAERRAALLGLLFAPVVLAELLDGISELAAGHVSLELFDAPSSHAGRSRLYAAGGPDSTNPPLGRSATAAHGQLQADTAISILGRDLGLRVRSTAAFDASHISPLPWLVFGSGALSSAMLALLLWQQASGRERVEQRARHMTVDLDRLSKVVQHTSSAVTLMDANLKITWVNAGFTRVSGYSLDEAVGRTPGSLLTGPNSDPATLQVLVESAAAGRDCRVEVLNRSKDGRDYWFNTGVQPLHDAEGRLIGFMEIGDDVTERHLAEEKLQATLRENTALLEATIASEAALRASQERLRQQNEMMTGVLECLPWGLCVFDAELKLVTSNSHLRRLLDLPDALFENSPTRYQDLVRFNAERGEYGSGDIEATVQTLTLRARPPVVPHVFERQRPNGTWLEIRGAPMPGGGLITTYTDVTARHAAEAEIQRSAQLLRGAIETIDEAFVLFDPDDRLVLCNEKYRHVYPGVAHLIVPGARFEDIVRAGAERGDYPAAIGRVDAWVAERLAAHRAGERALTQQLNDGRTLRIVERRMPDGHTVGFRIDITELVRATEAAQDASRAKGQFLANMSHEIRTPMNAILGMLTLLGRTELSARQLDYVDKTRGAAQALLELLNDILDFSKVEAGGLTLDPHPFRVDRLMHDVAVIAAGNLGTKPLEIRFEVDPGVPPFLVGDAMRLRQVLINLTGNAIKFTPEGEVMVQVSLIGHDADHVNIEFAVLDTGIGIAPEHQAGVFTGFTQAEASTTRRFGGTGLGLAISQRLVALMGSELALESALGQGSRFHFQLRMALPDTDWDIHGVGPEQGLKTPAGSAQRLAGLRLLVAEDNPNNQQVARELLEAEGAVVQLAADGREAVQAVTQTLATARPAFDAVLMDLQMPVMDGYEATREIRNRLALPGLPIVAMTANALASDRDACLAAGMNDHVGKPFDLDHLVQVLRLHTGRAAAIGRPLTRGAARMPAQVHAAAQAAGVNLEAALHRLGGKLEIYQRMLQGFVADLETMPAQLRNQIASGQHENAARALHTLKGLAGTLGATALARAAGHGQTRLAAARSSNAAAPAAEAAIGAVGDAVRRAAPALGQLARALASDAGPRLDGTGAEPAPDTSAAHRDAAVEMLRRLAAQLREADMCATDTSAALRREFGTLLGEPLRHLNDAVVGLDFDRALPLCENLLRSFLTHEPV